MEILLGAAAGIVSGLIGAAVAGVFNLTFKRLRGARAIRRGEPPYKDQFFQPLFPVYAIAGLIGGLVGGGLGDAWTCGAAGGLVLPTVASAAWIAACLAQLRR